MQTPKLIILWLFVAMFGIAGVLDGKQDARQQANLANWPGTKTQWHGFDRYDFEVNGRKAYVVVPSHIAPGRPWVWRARFPDFHAEADLILLNRGFHIARINTDGMLGSPRAMKHWDAFYAFVTKRGLAAKCALEGVSRGGLFVYGFASRWPNRVACIYCDTPVCDINSWPGGKGTGRGHAPTWRTCLQEYGLTEATAADFDGNPVDRLEPIANAQIPALHIVSLNDQIVPPQENTFVLAEQYRKLGGQIEVIRVAQGTEQSGGHHFTHPDPVRVADFIERFATTFPTQHDYFVLRGSLDNCRIKFERDKTGRVVFLGGSITTMNNGWREATTDYLRARFPETEFEFIDAGIPSTGSTPGAFRLLRDVFAKGNVDLLFEEAAVNDLHNARPPQQMTRGMEGILRHARNVNPHLDTVVLHFVDPKHMVDFRAGRTPEVIRNHEAVAEHYGVPTIHLAQEVTERIDAGQFDWKNDFRDCHPSPYGHRIYAATIRRLFSTAWSEPLSIDTKSIARKLPEVLDKFSYDAAEILALQAADSLQGFQLEEQCDPRAGGIGGSVRAGYHNVPMLVGTKPNDSFRIQFRGRAIGLFVAAGPDAGQIEFSIDGGDWQTLDLFTKWSPGLHIPWVYILDDELVATDHEVQIRISKTKNQASRGHACRIVNLLINN